MRSIPSRYLLSFLLPPPLSFGEGTKLPILDGCQVLLLAPRIGITGPSRERVFEQAAALIRLAGTRTPPMSIVCTLATAYPAGGCDSWSIIVGADIAFSPTSVDPYLPAIDVGPAPKPDPRPPPALRQASP